MLGLPCRSLPSRSVREGSCARSCRRVLFSGKRLAELSHPVREIQSFICLAPIIASADHKATSSSTLASISRRFGITSFDSHQAPPRTPPGFASDTMSDEDEIVSVEKSEEKSDDDDWGYWTAKGPRALLTHKVSAATASS